MFAIIINRKVENADLHEQTLLVITENQYPENKNIDCCHPS